MKKLTIHRMALARLRANAKIYRTMTAGIFLAVFLATTICLSIQGVFLAKLNLKNQQIGYLDFMVLDNPDDTDEMILDSGLFEKLGHVTVVGQAGDTELYLGYADAPGYELINYRLKEGRMPEYPGEIAMEESALLALDERLTVGSNIDLTVTPVEGVGETRSFTLVGILREKTEYLEMSYGGIRYSDSTVTKYPSMLLSPQEPAFRSGRLAVHRVMSLKKGISLRAAVSSLREYDYFISHMRYITPTGQILSYYDDFLSINAMGEEVMVLLICIAFLAVSLLTGCCVGIAGSMDAVLGKRSEEIGILRAVGATRRQIRRIYGRESFLLAALVAPIAIGCGCLCVAALEWMLPEQIQFRATLWLLLPVAALSAVVIFLAGWLPLNRASRKMPMSVLRDTELLRKAGKLKSSRFYRPARLLTLRRLRLYPGRQVGTILLAMLMFIGAGCLGCLSFDPVTSYAQGGAAFGLYDNSLLSRYSYFNDFSVRTLTWEDLAQIAALPKVTGVETVCTYQLTLLAEKESSYFKTASFLDEEQIQQIRAQLDTKLLPFPGITLIALDLSQFHSLSESLTDGRIDMDALNSGREVIVYAPTWWGRTEEEEDFYSLRYTGEQEQPEDKLICSNDYFHAGQELSLVQAYITGPYYDSDGNCAQPETRRRTVTVGAVIEEGFQAVGLWSPFNVITTLEGVRNLDLYTDGILDVDIFVAPGVDRELEDALAQRIEAIARRSSNVNFYNRLASARENAAQRGGLLLLFGCVTLIFFAAVVGMIRSTVTRQLQQDGRTIGMLRAVGAEEKTVLDCYSLPAYLSILLGMILSMALLALVIDLSAAKDLIPTALGVMAVFAAACCLACRGLLTRRVREITKQSIIDNIREL